MLFTWRLDYVKSIFLVLTYISSSGIVLDKSNQDIIWI